MAKKIPFSGSKPIEGQLFKDNFSESKAKNFFVYSSGKWQTISRSQYSSMKSSAPKRTTIATGEALWILDRASSFNPKKSSGLLNTLKNKSSNSIDLLLGSKVPQNWSWNVSKYTYSTGNGSFVQRPTLTINGKTYTPATPQDALNLINAAPIPSSEKSKARNLFNKPLQIANEWEQKQESVKAQREANKIKAKKIASLRKQQTSFSGVLTPGKIYRTTGDPSELGTRYFSYDSDGRWRSLGTGQKAEERYNALKAAGLKSGIVSWKEGNWIESKVVFTDHIDTSKSENITKFVSFLNGDFEGPKGLPGARFLESAPDTFKQELTKQQNHNLKWASNHPDKFKAKYGNKSPHEVYGVAEGDYLKFLSDQGLQPHPNFQASPPGTIPQDTINDPQPTAPGTPAPGTATDPSNIIGDALAPAAGKLLTEGADFDFENFSDLPNDVKQGTFWKSLNDDQKTLAYFTYKVQQQQNVAAVEDAQKALDQAIELVDPFFKEQIRIAKDTIAENVSRTQTDSAMNTERLQKRITDIESDLAFNRENLSIEEQAELSRQLVLNEQQLEEQQQRAAEAGLAFSSPRRKGEKRLRAQQADLAQSTKRRFARSRRELDVGAERGLRGLNEQKADVQKAEQRTLKDLQRAAEKLLGTSQAPSIPGVDPLGGVTGQLAEQKQSKIIQLQDVLKNKIQPFNF